MDSGTDTQQAIKTLYELYRHDIYRFARYTIRDESVAFDVVQEVFVRAMRSWSGFRHGANEKTWLLTIARNYIHDYLRKKKKWEVFVAENHEPFIASTGLSVETAMILEEYLMALKETYRQVFILRHIENLSVSQTAQVLGWSEGKVRTTDYRAVEKLRQSMGLDFERGEIVK